jgi:hypothetical protein
MLGRRARQVHLHEELDGLVRRPHGFVEPGHQRRAVDGVDHVEAPGFLRLVGLKMTDQMPPQAQIRRLVHLRQRFLNSVFAEVELSELEGAADVICGKGLETATSRTEAGSRPTRPAARAMRARTSSSRVRSADESITS